MLHTQNTVSGGPQAIEHRFLRLQTLSLSPLMPGVANYGVRQRASASAPCRTHELLKQACSRPCAYCRRTTWPLPCAPCWRSCARDSTLGPLALPLTGALPRPALEPPCGAGRRGSGRWSPVQGIWRVFVHAAYSRTLGGCGHPDSILCCCRRRWRRLGASGGCAHGRLLNAAWLRRREGAVEGAARRKK